MSVLILGGDKIDPIREVLYDMGVKSIIHWTARNQKNRCKKDRPIPISVEIVLMLTNFLNHNAMKHYRAEAKSKGLPIVYSTRNVQCVKDEFGRTLAELGRDSKVCRSCEQFDKCYNEE